MNDQQISSIASKFKLTNPHEIVMILMYICYFHPNILAYDGVIPRHLVLVLEKVARFMKANEIFWYDDKTMGDDRRRILKNFLRGSIRFNHLARKLKIFKFPEPLPPIT